MIKYISILLLLILAHSQDIYNKYYAEARKIAEAMTLDQLVGQMTQISFGAITNFQKQNTNPDQATTLFLGSLLVSGTEAPNQNGSLAKIPAILQYEKHIQTYKKANLTNWKKLTDRFQNIGVNVTTKDGKYKIKLLLATDAVHGDQHTVGNVVFPHNIGLSCTNNENNFENVGYWTKQGMKKSGFNYAFAPTVAVSHNPQWGRFYQTMGQNEANIQKYANAYVRGLQDVSNGKINGVLSSVKHFLADGATLYGCNEGNAHVLNSKVFVSHNIRGYVGGAKANAGSVMASYSAINWIPNAINGEYLIGTLRDQVKFNGFVISDYADLNKINQRLMPRTFMNFTQQQDAYATMINNGIDMFMGINKANVERLFKHIKKLTNHGYVPQSRLHDAVARILSVKLAMGLVQKLSAQDQPKIKLQQITSPPLSSSGNQLQDSLTAVRESLVLLKNTNVLPARSISSAIKYIVLVGQRIHNINRLTKIQLFRNFDNIGMQCGGWTVRFQGLMGNDFWTGSSKESSGASSILDALLNLQKTSQFQLIYANYSSFNSQISIQQDRSKFLTDLKTKRKDMNARNTLIIGTFGELPYAETLGDVNIPYCKVENNTGCIYSTEGSIYASGTQLKTLLVDFPKYDKDVISTIKQQDQAIPLVSVILSGRPMLLDQILPLSSAVIAAWLPGTSGGQGIVDAITGNYLIKPKGTLKNTLSMDWPRDMASLQNFPIYGTDGILPKINDPLFSVGYGLSTDS